MAEVMEQQVSEQRLQPTRIEYQDHAHQTWAVTVESGTDPLELERPAYWSLVCNRFRPRDKIEVWWEDGTRYAEYVVHSTDRRTWAKARPVLEKDFTSSDVVQTQAEMDALSGYEVKWRSMHHKFSVIRKSDSQVIHENEETREAADAWLRDYLKAMR